MDDLPQWSVRELKAECARFGVSSEGCTKDELVALVSRLRAAGPPPQAAGHGGVYTLYYYTRCQELVGRSHGILMCLEEAGVTYEIKEAQEVPRGHSTFAPPFLQMPDGTVLSQQAVICAAIGKTNGLYPKGFAEEFVGMNVAHNTTDLFTEVHPMAGGDARRIAKWFSTYEAALQNAGTGYMVGHSLTYADLYAYQLVRYCAEKRGAKPGPKLAAWLAMMAQCKASKSLAAQNILTPGGVPFMPPWLPKRETS